MRTPRLRMERGNGSTEDLTRVLDLASPIGRGQRGLIVAPPKVKPCCCRTSRRALPTTTLTVC